MTVTDQMIRETFEAVENETAKLMTWTDGSVHRWWDGDSELPKIEEVARRLGVTVERVSDVMVAFWGSQG